MNRASRMPKVLLFLRFLLISIAAIGASNTSDALECEPATFGEKSLFWGDLHVHTSYSLDANVYGTLASPADAYRFAKGAPMTRADGSVVQLARPLDFVAVTEHAEWLDFTSLCDNKHTKHLPDCDNLVSNRSPGGGPKLFGQYVLSSIAGPTPEPLTPCSEDPQMCRSAALDRWQSIQEQTNAAYEPCKFTTLHGYEWSHTPDYRHAHRNVIFRSDAVTEHAIDYINYPTVSALWSALDQMCSPEDGCDALAIPHNTNMGDGISFEILESNPTELSQRARYERLIEITQEKGTSECLPQYGTDGTGDCDFELYLTRKSRPTEPDDYSKKEWQDMRSSYARSLVGRGLAFTGDASPLRLGFIGSTDTHSATPGYVDEHVWSGSVFAGPGFDGAMLRKNWSAGGLVGVWATENTREAIFDALHRRETYATSGPRIGLRFGVDDEERSSCDTNQWRPQVNMGQVSEMKAPPTFAVQVQTDTAPIATIEMIKITRGHSKINEEVIQIWMETDASMTRCVSWRDTEFEPTIPTLWYPRVQQEATPRWSSVQCAKAGRCDEFPEVDVAIQERAWGSPIWHLP